MNANTYTDNQKIILIAAGMPEDRLNDGRLIESERRLLKALALAEDYLGSRYPDVHFAFTGLDNSAPRGQLYHFLVSAEEETFAVLVRFSEDGEDFAIKDSYFNLLKKNEVNALCENVLAEFGLEAKADLRINGVYDQTYNAQAALEESLKNGKKIGVIGWVFANEVPELEKMLPEIEKALCSRGLCGSFELRLVQRVTPAQAYDRPRSDRSFVVSKHCVSLPDQGVEVK